MNRRKFLATSLSALLGVPATMGTNGLGNRPDRKAGVFMLNAAETQWTLVEGSPKTNIWSFRKNSFAPIIRGKQGETLKIETRNSVDDAMTVHWHGMRLPNSMDGVPKITQPPIRRGERFQYSFASPDAGTYWYHPHSNSVEQISRGLVGPLIIEEEKPYPADEDRSVLLSDWRLGKDMQIVDDFYGRHDLSHEGRLGNLVTANGKANPEFKFKPNSRIRLRFINAANARFFTPVLGDFAQATLITMDGHPVDPRPYQPILLSPGMRFDVVVDIPSEKKRIGVFDQTYKRHSIPLINISVEGKPMRHSPLNVLPPALPENPIPTPGLSSANVHQLNLDGGAMSMGMMRGMMTGVFWTVNGKSMDEEMDYAKPILSLKKGQTQLFKIRNNTRFEHPIHLHGHTFKVLRINGRKLEEPYWSDTVLVSPNQVSEIAFVADNPGLWMLHCHVLDHQVSGMMGVVEVA